MTNHARNGRAREYRIRDHMIAHGWLCVMRAAASKGPADLAMLHPLRGLAWVQVGSAKSKALSPADRDRLVSVAEQTHALALLATSGTGVPTRYWEVTRDTARHWKEIQL